MASLVFLKNKKNGKTYVYESINYWDKNEKKSKSKRKLIGIKNEETGEIEPTSTQKKKLKEIETKKLYGANLLLSLISKKLGIDKNLSQAFPELHKEILAVSQYLIMEENNSISRYEKWDKLHRVEGKRGLTSQRISELFSNIDENGKNEFFKLQAKNLKKDEYWAYDTTSISSYSKMINQMKYGYNKENDAMAQINLAVLYGEKSQLPFYYRILPGNIVDVSTVKKLIDDIIFLEINKPKLVMDRGFFSKGNITELLDNKFKFIVGTRQNLTKINEAIDKITDIKKFSNYIHEYGVYGVKKIIQWDKNEDNRTRHIYLYVFFNDEKEQKDYKDFMNYLSELKKDILENIERESRKEDYRKYFDIKVKKGKIEATPIDKAINEHSKKYGFFSLISNENLEKEEVLKIYRQKDVVEKAFHNIKDRLDLRRVRVSTKPTLDGKIFVTFVSLILISYIKNKMRENKLFEKYTLQELLDEVDLIECYKNIENEIKLSEMTNKQKEIFKYMEVEIPEKLIRK